MSRPVLNPHEIADLRASADRAMMAGEIEGKQLHALLDAYEGRGERLELLEQFRSDVAEEICGIDMDVAKKLKSGKDAPLRELATALICIEQKLDEVGNADD